jgi:hypothetical protein
MSSLVKDCAKFIMFWYKNKSFLFSKTIYPMLTLFFWSAADPEQPVQPLPVHQSQGRTTGVKIIKLFVASFMLKGHNAGMFDIGSPGATTLTIMTLSLNKKYDTSHNATDNWLLNLRRVYVDEVLVQ